MPKRRLYWSRLSPYIPAILIYAAIFLLSSRPASDFPNIAPDIVPHFLEYCILGYFLARAVRRSDPRALALLSLALLALALLDEIHQYYVPTRFFELKDLVVDFLGACSGLALFRFFFLKRRQSPGA